MNRREALTKALSEIESREAARDGMAKFLEDCKRQGEGKWPVRNSLMDILTSKGIPGCYATELASRVLPVIVQAVELSQKAVCDQLATQDVDALAKHYEKQVDLKQPGVAVMKAAADALGLICENAE